jgi:predicted PurR-regulated permease PerM
MGEDLKENKKPHLIWIIIIVLIIIIGFVLTFGNYIPKSEQKIPRIYDDIDFNKLHENIENEIKSRNQLLEKIRTEKTDLLKEINKSINWLKGIISGVWIIANVIMFFCCKEKYTINEFIQLNEGLIIVLVFTLFMISEKFTSLHLAFEALKKGIVKNLTERYRVSEVIEEKIRKEIYLLEAIYYTHPSIIQLKQKL